MISINTNKIAKQVINSPFFIVAIIGILLRITMTVFYSVPTWFPDSDGYHSLASVIINLDFNNYAGWRTPGYPLIIILSLGKYSLVAFLQSMMDIISSFFVYDVLKKHSQKLAFFASLLMITLLNLVFYSFSILTETSSLFFLSFAIWLVIKNRIIYLENSKKVTLYTSLVLMITFLIRPMFIYVSPILAVFMLSHLNKANVKIGLFKIVIILVFPFSAYFGWSSFNYHNHNWFTVTTYYGINLAQNSASFFDEVPDKHRIIRDIYMKHIKDTESIIDGTMVYENPISSDIYNNMVDRGDFETIEAMSIWRAYGELISATNLEGQDLSHKLFIISKELIKNNPQAYTTQVIKNWIPFWCYNDLPIRDQNIKNSKAIGFIKKAWVAQKGILILLSILLIPVTIISLIKSIVRKNFFNTSNFLLAIIIAASILQALVTYGSNGRFSFPVISIIIIVTSLVGNNVTKTKI